MDWAGYEYSPITDCLRGCETDGLGMGKNTFQWVCLGGSETDWNGLGKGTCDLDGFRDSQKD